MHTRYARAMAEKETHTRARPVRIPKEDWDDIGVLVGDRERSRLIREFISWYLRRPRTVLPKRPSEEAIRDLNAARNIASD